MLTVLAGDVLADRVGKSPARVLALHGWGRSGADFARVLEGTDALAVHLPGFGPTEPPPEVWGSVEYADHLAAALEGLEGSGPYVVVAHSFGGRVAVRLAASRPHLVDSLVLTGVPLVRATSPPRPRPALRLAKRLHAAHLLPEGVVDRLRRRGGSADYQAAQGVMRGVLVRLVGEDYREDLARVAAAGVPVDMVWGELDDAAPLAGARLAAELLPGARLVVVPGAGHLLDGALEQAVRTAVLSRLGGSA
ncbi:alpha/beta fold hydrolase [Actinotalea ferrariae]|uniref:alpha/beta fold hydrolase n=1 Tax=Actinotalea ferrariae TaxID=1386098 RepID=UPI001C8CDF32|nr:alpha/beta fold hydrolase [Actinotalea ferrariae]MBX9244439.1 alpha/beta fold hydrolase [Actinotalea ferrariae]